MTKTLRSRPAATSIPKKLPLLLAFLSILKLWLSSALVVHAATGQSADDALYVRLAGSILAGQWLGPYESLTLAKAPGYPLWLAFNANLGAPLLLTQQVLYVLAGIVFVVAIAKVVRRPTALALAYTLYLFNPSIETRVIREGIYPALSVLVLAGMIGVVTRRQGRRLILGLWTGLTGVACLLFWITREEGVWMVPSLVLLLGYAIFRLYQSLGISRELVFRGVLCTTPFLVLWLGLQALSFVNLLNYGTYTTWEVNSRPFTSAYGALTRVRPETWRRYLDVPQEVRRAIYSVSPAFLELQPALDGRAVIEILELRAIGCNLYPETCGDIAGGYFLWVLREAVAWRGHYASAAEASDYYERLAREVDAACAEGRLECVPERSTLIPLLRREHVLATARAFLLGVQRIVSMPALRHAYDGSPHSGGTPEGLALFSDVTGGRVSPLVGTRAAAPSRAQQVHLAILRAIQKAYRPLLYLTYPALGLYALCVLAALSRRSVSILLVLNTAILAALATRLLILSYIEISSFHVLFSGATYLTPFYPLLILFLVLSVVESVGSAGVTVGSSD